MQAKVTGMQRMLSRRAADAAGRVSASAGTTRAVGPALLAAAVLSTVLAAAAAAQGIKRLGEFGDWRAYTFQEEGGASLTCYIASQPTRQDKLDKRGDIFAMVTHRPSDETRDEVSLSAGYNYKKETRVEVSIDGRKFELFPFEDTAWTPDTASDQKLVAAMKAGRTMVVRGTSDGGTLTQDTFSLIGFTKAYGAINSACGL